MWVISPPPVGNIGVYLTIEYLLIDYFHGSKPTMSPMVSRPLSIELSLFGFLRAGPLHGYQIHQKLSEATRLGLIWRLKQSRLYSLLDKLDLITFVLIGVVSFGINWD